MIPWNFADLDTIIDNYSEYEKWKMRKSCVRCSHIRLQDISNPCDDCTNFCNWKPQTNADRIRSMSDEELADFLYKYMDCTDCPIECDPGKDICLYKIMEWLKRE